ncbi:MAG: precorrin-3B C(17)-methyltransferase, partial [Pseudomonadota bacterium]
MTVIIVLSAAGVEVARALKAQLAPAEIHGLAGRVSAEAVDETFSAAAKHIGGLFAAGRSIVGVCAAGILIRAVAPHLAEKATEPAVVAVAQDGSAVVPLLGAHRGGSDLARRAGIALDIAPADTAMSEVRLPVVVDDPPPGWTVADLRPFKSLAAHLGAGGGIDPDGDIPFLAPLPKGTTPVRATVAQRGDTGTIATYIAERLALGIGAERGADPAAAIALATKVLAEGGYDPRAVSVVVSLDVKADETAVHAVADHLGAPARFFDRAALAAEEARLANPSEIVRAAVGVAGVCEAAALAAAGPKARLVAPKTVAEGVTVALALAPDPVPRTVGRARGHLAIVGTGPGSAALRTKATVTALAEADVYVGYSLYLDLVEDVRGHQPRHDFALGDEAARVRHALELAGEGKRVALISSGDPGIYAMASLAMELLDQGELSDAARRVAVTVVPGVSAAQAAAALSGAPLGHDFAFISLSDLLTPWAVIRQRLEAAAKGDFAVALYNPRSARRTTQLVEALDVFCAARAPDTPVIIASNVGREGERVRHETLKTFDPKEVDMLSTVIIGASTTRRF